MGLAHAISKVTTPIFMGVVYFLVITPVGFVRCAVGGNPLRAHRGASGWVDRRRVASGRPHPSILAREGDDSGTRRTGVRAVGVHEGPEEVVAAPILIVMLLVGALLVFAQGSALAPFIYTIF